MCSSSIIDGVQFIDTVGRLWMSTRRDGMVCLTDKIEQLRSMTIVDSSMNYLLDDKGIIWEIKTNSLVKKMDSTGLDSKIIKIKLCNYSYIYSLTENGKVYCGTTCVSNNVTCKISDISCSEYKHILALGLDNKLYGEDANSNNNNDLELGNSSEKYDQQLSKINISYIGGINYNLGFNVLAENIAIDETG